MLPACDCPILFQALALWVKLARWSNHRRSRHQSRAARPGPRLAIPAHSESVAVSARQSCIAMSCVASEALIADGWRPYKRALAENGTAMVASPAVLVELSDETSSVVEAEGATRTSNHVLVSGGDSVS